MQFAQVLVATMLFSYLLLKIFNQNLPKLFRETLLDLSRSHIIKIVKSNKNKNSALFLHFKPT